MNPGRRDKIYVNQQTVKPVVRLKLVVTVVAASTMLAPELSPTAMPSVLLVLWTVALANTMLEVLSKEIPNTPLP